MGPSAPDSPVALTAARCDDDSVAGRGGLDGLVEGTYACVLDAWLVDEGGVAVRET